MKIEIIGSNCKNGMQLYKNIQKATKNYEDIEVIKDDEVNSLKKHNIKNKPGLLINDKLICEGKVLTEREISKLVSLICPA